MKTETPEILFILSIHVNKFGVTEQRLFGNCPNTGGGCPDAGRVRRR